MTTKDEALRAALYTPPSPVQALGAGISRRNWYEVERAYERIRDLERDVPPAPADDTAALRAENERLRAALEPFAKLADAYDPPEGDDDHTTWDQTALATLGDLRRARAVLNEGGEDA